MGRPCLSLAFQMGPPDTILFSDAVHRLQRAYEGFCYWLGLCRMDQPTLLILQTVLIVIFPNLLRAIPIYILPCRCPVRYGRNNMELTQDQRRHALIKYLESNSDEVVDQLLSVID